MQPNKRNNNTHSHHDNHDNQNNHNDYNKTTKKGDASVFTRTCFINLGKQLIPLYAYNF